MKNVLCIDNLFGHEHLLRSVSAEYACLVVFGPSQASLQASIAGASGAAGLHVESHHLPSALDVRSARFTATLMLWIVTNAYISVERKWSCAEQALSPKAAI